MNSDRRHGEKFMRLMCDDDPKVHVYAYRWDGENRKRLSPAVYNGPVNPKLIEILRVQHNGGEFNVMVRRGEVMELSERVVVVPYPRQQPEAFEAFKKKYGW